MTGMWLCIMCAYLMNLRSYTSTLQESTTAIVLKGSTGGLRGASKFLVKNEYALLSKDKESGGGQGGDHGGGRK